MGVDLTLVGNGREAVEAWAPGRFDIILMDVQMPEMDGVDATRTIRAAEAAQRAGADADHRPDRQRHGHQVKTTWPPAWTPTWPSRSN